MRVLGILFSLTLILLALLDAFETILQPRRVTHRFRYARLYYRWTWKSWRGLARPLGAGSRREAFLSTFGPISLLGLFFTWVLLLILGFAILHAALSSPLYNGNMPVTFRTYLYFSATNFITLSFGDILPADPYARILTVTEAGVGYAFLAVIISYLPVLFQAYSHRELSIALLDARAGSPPSAAELLLRLGRAERLPLADTFLAEWELWAAELLESHLSFPVLSYYRSQHDNQSWLAALTTILDTSALLIADASEHNTYQAQLTFAVARHAAVDLSLVLKLKPVNPPQSRIPIDRFVQLQGQLAAAGLALHRTAESAAKFEELRSMYEPFINGLAAYLLFTVPPIVPVDPPVDNWQRSAWMQRAPAISNLPTRTQVDDHFS